MGSKDEVRKAAITAAKAVVAEEFEKHSARLIEEITPTLEKVLDQAISKLRAEPEPEPVSESITIEGYIPVFLYKDTGWDIWELNDKDMDNLNEGDKDWLIKNYGFIEKIPND